jgi:hypothetical protein
MELTPIPESRNLTRVGNSYGGTVPKSLLKQYGLIDENGEPAAVGTPVYDAETGRVGIVFESDEQSASHR